MQPFSWLRDLLTLSILSTITVYKIAAADYTPFPSHVTNRPPMYQQRFSSRSKERCHPSQAQAKSPPPNPDEQKAMGAVKELFRTFPALAQGEKQEIVRILSRIDLRKAVLEDSGNSSTRRRLPQETHASVQDYESEADPTDFRSLSGETPVSSQQFSDGYTPAKSAIDNALQQDESSQWGYHPPSPGPETAWVEDISKWDGDNEQWTSGHEPSYVTLKNPVVTRIDLGIMIRTISFFLSVLNMIERTMTDLCCPQSELEVATNTILEAHSSMRQDLDPVITKYMGNGNSGGNQQRNETNAAARSTPSLTIRHGLPSQASIETWQGVRDVQMPPDLLAKLPPCPRCMRPGVCAKSCVPLSKKDFATNMLEAQKRSKAREDCGINTRAQ